MAVFAIAVPVLPGKSDQLRTFIGHLNEARKSDYLASRKRLGVRERSFIQHTPDGEIVVVTLEGDDPAGAFARFAEGKDSFTQWFKEQVLDIHGVDLSQPPPGPLPKLVIDSGA